MAKKTKNASAPIDTTLTEATRLDWADLKRTRREIEANQELLVLPVPRTPDLAGTLVDLLRQLVPVA